MVILGVHSGHECGAALIKDGQILAAVNGERITRNKLEFGVPFKSIKEVIKQAGISFHAVDEIALETINEGRFLISHGRPWICRLFFTHGKGLLDFFIIRRGKLVYFYGFKAILLNFFAMTGLPRFLLVDFLTRFYLRSIFGWQIRITNVTHHYAHLASAYFTGGMDNALSVVIEEYDGKNAMVIDLIEDGKVTRVAQSPYPHSPGVFYCLATRILGFNQFIHAGKVTGLAGYGCPKRIYPLVEKLIWDEEMQVRLSPKVYQLSVEYAKSKTIPKYLNNFSCEDIAAGFQRRLEDVIVNIVTRAIKKTGAKNIVLSGGVTANVRMNQRILNIPGVERLFIHPGMSDCGTGLGAALWLAHIRKKNKPRRLKNVFFGYAVTNDEIENELEKQKLRYTREYDIHKKIAQLLVDKKIVVRVTGRMEYGPRALGNRSILYHANDPTVNKWLNQRLRRTEFMPFAPAVLAEYAKMCFCNYHGAEYAAEFMTITFDCTEWMKKNCPAVVHVDGTARPQFVTKDSNPDFYAILSEYNSLTGIPVLINTSYNIHDEPIVRSASDAFRVFKLTCLDYIAVNNYLISAKENNLVWPSG